MYDLHFKIAQSRERDAKGVLKRAIELGYDCIAWNTSVAGKIGTGIKPQRQIDLDIGSEREAKSSRSLVNSFASMKPIRQLSRITITIDELVDANNLTAGNEILRSFDVVAARAGNAKIFSYLCRQAEIDIISIDFTHRLPFSLNKKLLDEAVARGIHFEVTYSTVLGAAGARREMISGTRVLLQYLRGRNLILSSGADSFTQLRAPLDVCNIGMVLGLNQEQAMQAISGNCAAVLQRALSRRCRYLPLEIQTQSSFKARWPEAYLYNTQRGQRSTLTGKTGTTNTTTGISNGSKISAMSSSCDLESMATASNRGAENDDRDALIGEVEEEEVNLDDDESGTVAFDGRDSGGLDIADSESSVSSDDSGGFDDSEDEKELQGESEIVIAGVVGEFSDVESNLLQGTLIESDGIVKSSTLAKRAESRNKDGDAGDDSDADDDGNFTFDSDADKDTEEIEMKSSKTEKGLGSDDFVSFDNRTFSFNDNDGDDEGGGDNALATERRASTMNRSTIPKSISAALQYKKAGGLKTPTSVKFKGTGGTGGAIKMETSSSVQSVGSRNKSLNKKASDGKRKVNLTSVSSTPTIGSKRPFTPDNASSGKPDSFYGTKMKKSR